MYQHLKQKIVTLLTVLCLTVGAGGTAAAAEPTEREPTLLEIAAKVAQYSKCRSLPLRERPKCAKEFAVKSTKFSLAVALYLYISLPTMKDEGAAFAEVNKELVVLDAQLRGLLDQAKDEADPERRRVILKQVVTTYKAAKPHLDNFRTNLVKASRTADRFGEPSAELVALITVWMGDYFPVEKPAEPSPEPTGGTIFDDLEGMVDALKEINAGFDQANAGLDKMNDAMVEVNDSIAGMNDGLAQANRGMDQLNEGVRQMNTGLGQTNKAVQGFNKVADRIHEVPDIKFDFSQVADNIGANSVPPEQLAAQDRRMSLLLDLIPGISDGKGVLDAITGKDIVSGEKLSLTDRALGATVVLHWLRVGGKLTPEDIHAARKGDKDPDCFDSFPAGTGVVMGDGTTRPIEQVKIGDSVLATDPETGTTGPRPVEATIYTPDDRDFTTITLRPQDGQGSLTATDHHPFWSENRKQWTDASDLNTGDTLRTPDSTTVQIGKVTHWKELQPTYNLTVNDLHTYYVLAERTPVLVHNCGNLQKDNDVAGGHAFKDHVGKTDQNLIDRAKAEKHEASSLHPDTAQDRVNDVLATVNMNRWGATCTPGQQRDLGPKRFNSPIGRVADTSGNVEDAYALKLVVRCIARGTDGHKGTWIVYTMTASR